MRIKKFLLILAVVLPVASAWSQDTFMVRVKSGWGTYGMYRMRQFQALVSENLRVNGRITEDYPAYFYYQLQLLSQNKDGYIRGLLVDYASTGGRVAYADATGSYRFDQRIERIALGAHLEEELFRNEHFQVSSALQLLLYTSLLSLDEVLTVEDEVNVSSPELSVLGGSAGIMFGAGYRPFKWLECRLDIGYEAQVFSETYRLTRSPNFLANRLERQEFRPNWSGFRGGVSIGWLF